MASSVNQTGGFRADARQQHHNPAIRHPMPLFRDLVATIGIERGSVTLTAET
jgi:hypothetical protein